MVLPAPPAHASPAESRWLDRLIVAIELSAQGVLTLVDHAAPSRLREAYLRLRARDPATEVIVDVRALAGLPPGTTAILALEPSVGDDDLDWLNLNRPVVSDRRLSIVLWCEDGAAAALAQRAPDFFDWISARVDCPPAPAAHAVADVRRAICARASGIAWDGPGLEETLAAIRPGRPIRRVAVGSYQSMIDALTSREPGWLFLEGIDTHFHLRRLRWAMAETGRRIIVIRRSIQSPAPGWWTVDAMHAPIVEAVHVFAAVGGSGRLAALTGLDPQAGLYARLALGQGIKVEYLEHLLATISDPRAALQELELQPRWLADGEAARYTSDDEPVIRMLRKAALEPGQWTQIAGVASHLGDFEVAVRWLTAALALLPGDVSPLRVADLRMLRGRAYRRAGQVANARADLEFAHSIAQDTGDVSLIVRTAVSLANALLTQGEPIRAREYIQSLLSMGTEFGDEAPPLLDVLAMALEEEGDLVGARRYLERSLAMKRRIFATEDHPDIAISLDGLGSVLAAQGDMEGARSYFERALDIRERFYGRDNPNVVADLYSLADIHLAMGEVNSARTYAERALNLQRHTFGTDDHPHIADTLVVLARVLMASGDLDGACANLERALATQQKLFGNDGQLAGATTRRELADMFVAKGDIAGAVAQLERALATFQRIFEHDDHPNIEGTLRELERLRQLQRNLQRTD